MPLLPFLALAAAAVSPPPEVFNEARVGIAARFVPIPAGNFMMGSPPEDRQRFEWAAAFVNEIPHKVNITRPFEMQATMVTQLQWTLVMGANPAKYSKAINCGGDHREIDGIHLCPNRPVESTPWIEIHRFIDKLNALEDGYVYRLPTEAEWEYAARAGTQTTYFYGNDPKVLEDFAWVRVAGSPRQTAQTQSVALKPANAWGLYDMAGNLSQWVQDYYHDYPEGEVSDPVQLEPTTAVRPEVGSYDDGKRHMVRGGSWHDIPDFCRVSARMIGPPWSRFPRGIGDIFGFRLVRTRNSP